MPIKSGARQETVFETVRMLVEKGLTVEDAIMEVESILHGKLPEHIKDMIRREVG